MCVCVPSDLSRVFWISILERLIVFKSFLLFIHFYSWWEMEGKAERPSKGEMAVWGGGVLERATWVCIRGSQKNKGQDKSRHLIFLLGSQRDSGRQAVRDAGYCRVSWQQAVGIHLDNSSREETSKLLVRHSREGGHWRAGPAALIHKGQQGCH